MMELKPFQRATVQHVITQLEEHGRFLVADEVGLGKTIVARGVIEQLCKQYSSKNDPLHVVYICSNQLLAGQNIRKLCPPNAKARNAYNRLFLMVQEPMGAQESPQSDQALIHISTLTPSTSLHMTNSLGIVAERAILYVIVERELPASKSRLERERLDELFKGAASKSWEQTRDWYKQNLSLRGEAAEDLRTRFRDEGIYEQITRYCEDHSNDNQSSIIKAMRRIVTNLVLEKYLNADLFILDEFQKFRELVAAPPQSTEDGQHVSKGKQADELHNVSERIFADPSNKVLLLSATPFRAYTTQAESEIAGDDHYQELTDLLLFLSRDSDSVSRIDTQRDAFRKSLRSLLTARETSSSNSTVQDTRDRKQALETSLLEYLSRTERAVAINSSLVGTASAQLVHPGMSDIKGAVYAIRLLDRAHNGKRGSSMLISLAKSSPFCLSFLTGYKLNDFVPSALDEHQNGEDLFLPLERWDSYSLKPAELHNRLGELIQHVFPDRHERTELLWIPPSLPYYQTVATKQTTGYSKTLIFSAWKLVPRALSILLSYEHERRLFQGSNLTFFQDTADGESTAEARRPRPLLHYRSGTTGSDSERRAFRASSLCTLLYPSEFLAGIDFGGDRNQTVEQLRARVSQQIVAHLGTGEPSKETKYHYWYWYAPFVLDRDKQSQRIWLDGTWIPSHTDEEASAQSTTSLKAISANARREFLASVKSNMELLSSEHAEQDPRPQNLATVLTEIALGSPAVCALRALTALYPHELLSTRVEAAGRVADGFVSTYNKPESIAIIRGVLDTAESRQAESYWLQCLKYGTEHNIQAMLEEYMHLLSEHHDEPIGLADAVADLLHVKSSQLQARFIKEDGKTIERESRCHVALDFGKDKLDSPSGEKRMVSIRDAFNSPFRPFVLTTTSIGQEGLDLHWYCRNICHWNLPHNPIDIEQREGRINRFKSHVIRLNLARRAKELRVQEQETTDIWTAMFQAGEKIAQRTDKTGLSPYWHIDPQEGDFQLNRMTPLYAFSADQQKHELLIRMLALYRLVFGQPDQEQLMHTLLQSEDQGGEKVHELRTLFLNLAPVSHQNHKVLVFCNRPLNPTFD